MTKKLLKPLTRKGFNTLADEHEHLFKTERPKIVKGIAIAAAEGDRSENAEYIYGKKKLREIDKRLKYLTHLLKDIKIVDPEKLSGDKVCFGSTVTVINENDEEKKCTIVGEGEADYKQNTISWKSPVGMKLIGRKVGEFVVVIRPAGETEFEITNLQFAGRNWDA